MPAILISDEDRSALTEAKETLENPGLAVKIVDIIGTPIEKALTFLPPNWRDAVQNGANKALMTALKAAVVTLDDQKGHAASNFFHKVLCAASGAIGGVFGLATLPVELPLSTVLMLRSIADIARSEGEDIKSIETNLACLEVFALGGRSASDDASETGYFAVRAVLAREVSEAAKFIAEKGLVEEAPVVVRLITAIASRFGTAVSEKVAAQIVPVVGAVGGALVNILFIDHFQDVARGHFTVRRLERTYGAEEIKKLYCEISVGRPKGTHRLLASNRP